MSEAPARRARSARFSRRAVLIASLAILVLSIGALATLFKPRAAPRAAAPPRIAATVTADEAELKKEPAAGAGTVAKLARGARLEIRREAGLWVEVQSAAGKGFLPAEAVERDSDRDARKRRAPRSSLSRRCPASSPRTRTSRSRRSRSRPSRGACPRARWSRSTPWTTPTSRCAEKTAGSPSSSRRKST